MKTRDLFIACLALAFAVLCYFVGYRHGARTQKKTDTEFNIRRSLRLLHDAENAGIAKITNGCRMFLLGHTKAYTSFVSESDIPESFRQTLAEARQIAAEVQTNLVVFDPRHVDE